MTAPATQRSSCVSAADDGLTVGPSPVRESWFEKIREAKAAPQREALKTAVKRQPVVEAPTRVLTCILGSGEFKG
jgi:hypothetical protein